MSAPFEVLVLGNRGYVVRRLTAVILVSEAREMARTALADALPRRWEHVQSVAGKAERVAACLALRGDILVAVSWLHDIGYAPGIAETARVASEPSSSGRLRVLLLRFL